MTRSVCHCAKSGLIALQPHEPPPLPVVGAGPVVRLADGREMINVCANNYLGLANHPAVLRAAHDVVERYGYGVASVRFICRSSAAAALTMKIVAYAFRPIPP